MKDQDALLGSEWLVNVAGAFMFNVGLAPRKTALLNRAIQTPKQVTGRRFLQCDSKQVLLLYITVYCFEVISES